MNYNGNTAAGEKPSPVSEMTFDSLLDETCDRLMDRQVQYSIRRIYEMEKRLEMLERELEEFIQKAEMK
jgi:transposase